MRRKCLIIIIVIFAVYSSGRGQTSSDNITMPTLNGHTFVSYPLISEAFINTSFTSRLGIQQTTNLTIPLPDFLPDTLQGLNGNLLFADLGFGYRQKVKDWIAFYLNINVAVRSGTELRSILREGFNTLIGGETGVIFNISHGLKHQLSGTVSVNNYQGTLINVGQFVRDIINNVPDPSLTRNVPALSVGGGVNYAYAINKVMGLALMGGAYYGESLSRGEESFKFRIGGTLDFNWATKDVPIGIAVSYMLRSTADYVYLDKKLARNIGVMIAYTGTPDFVLGVEVLSSKVPTISLPDKVTVVGALLNMKYYFN